MMQGYQYHHHHLQLHPIIITGEIIINVIIIAYIITFSIIMFNIISNQIKPPSLLYKGLQSTLELLLLFILLCLIL